eukprot:3160767-Amphidinium_carterae.2
MAKCIFFCSSSSSGVRLVVRNFFHAAGRQKRLDKKPVQFFAHLSVINFSEHRGGGKPVAKQDDEQCPHLTGP